MPLRDINGTPNGFLRSAPLLAAVEVKPSAAVADVIKQRPWPGDRARPGAGNYSAETAENRLRYRQMFRDATVKATVLSKIWGVATLDLSVSPAGDTDRDKVVAEFHDDNLANSPGGTRGLVEACLIGALMDGYCLAHRQSRTEDRGRWAGKTVLAGLRPKDSDYYDLVVNDYRAVVGVRDKADPDPDRVLPLDEFVLVRHLQIFDNPWGMSDFRAADRAYCCLDAVSKLRLIFLDKFQGPYLVGKYTDAQVRAALAAQLEDARGASYITVPVGAEIDVIELARGSDEAFNSAVNSWREEIATAIAGAFLQMMAGQVPGGRGSSAEHNNTADLFRWYCARLVCDAVNAQVIPFYTDENFAGRPGYPKADLAGLDPVLVGQVLATAEQMHGMDVPLSRKALYLRSGWPPPKDEGDELPGVRGGSLFAQPEPPPLPPAGAGGLFPPAGDEDEGADVPVTAAAGGGGEGDA